MWARESLVCHLPKVSGALVRVPLEGVVLSHAAQRASPRARPAPTSGLSFHIIRIPQVTRAVHAFKRVDRPITVNIKTWIIAWERRGARLTP